MALIAKTLHDATLVRILTGGGIGVLPTDTLLGLVGSALQMKTVERIYRVRKRDPAKPPIVLIPSMASLKQFGIKPRGQTLSILKKVWPGKVSVILPRPGRKFRYLHRGTDSIAFRVPKNSVLRVLLSKTGPLIAPSANLEGEPPAKNFREAKKYFGENADFYVRKAPRSQIPSKIISLEKNRVVVLRA